MSRRCRLSAALLLAACFLLPPVAHPHAGAVDPARLPVARVTPSTSPPATRALIQRLNQHMRALDRDYFRLGRAGRIAQVRELDALLGQLRGRSLHRTQQVALFKIEMRLRALRDELAGRR